MRLMPRLLGPISKPLQTIQPRKSIQFKGFDDASVIRQFGLRIPGSCEFYLHVVVNAGQMLEHHHRQLQKLEDRIQDLQQDLNDDGYDYDNRDHDYDDRPPSHLENELASLKQKTGPLGDSEEQLRMKLIETAKEAPLPFVRELYVAIGRNAKFNPSPSLVSIIENRLSNTFMP